MAWGCPASGEPTETETETCECSTCMMTEEAWERCDAGCVECATDEEFYRKLKEEQKEQ